MRENEFYDCSYEGDTMQHLKNVELNMLKEVIEICKKNNLHYHLHAGSLLGAIRHEGFIPWDDEIDVGMFRSDYEKFLKIIINEYEDKYYISNWKTEFNVKDDVFTPQSFLCLKNTKIGENQDKGIYLDIAVMDVFPKSSVKQWILIKFLKLIHYMFFIFHALTQKKYSTNFRKSFAKSMKSLLKVIHITPKFALKIYSKIVSNEDIKNCSYVCNSSFYYDKPIPIEAFNGYTNVKFESEMVCIPKKYEIILNIYYGNYMELPPRDKRKDHNFSPIDFGEY